MASSNAYGFDFLKSEHQLADDAAAASRPDMSSTLHRSSLTFDTTPDFEAVRRMNFNEKIYTVREFLKSHRSSGYLAPSVIFKTTGIDLSELDTTVADELARQEDIAIEEIFDPENPSLTIPTYAYQSKFSNVRDRASLLSQINSSRNGIQMSSLQDCYDHATQDIFDLITSGETIAIDNKEIKDKILFPRGEVFHVELDGIVTLQQQTTNGQDDGGGSNTTDTVSSSNNHNTPPPGDAVVNNNKKDDTSTDKSRPMTDDEVVAAAIRRNKAMNAQKDEKKQDYLVVTDVDPRIQIRRGEAIFVGGQWFRVSSAVQDGPLSMQPVRAQAPLSVVSNSPMDKRNEIDGYIRPFTNNVVPLDHPMASTTRDNLQKAKTARDQLHKLAGIRGLSGGVAAQLLSPLVSTSNPTTLAASGGRGAAGGISRKRPATATAGTKSPHHHSVQSEQAKKDAEAAHRAATDPRLAQFTHARRHGCTVDVRDMYRATKDLVPTDEVEFHKVLVEHKLLEPGEAMRRARMPQRQNVDSDGKTKKRRYYERKGQRRTNTHLQNTPQGAILDAALDMLAQGKQVGDGGM